MQYILNKRYNGTASINFIGSVVLDSNNKVLVLETPDPITGVTKITGINYEYTPSAEYIQVKFKIKICELWSDLLDISELTAIELNKDCPIGLKIYFYFVDEGNSSAPATTISNVIVETEYNILTTDGIITLTTAGDEVILEPKDIYKIFDLEDFIVSQTGLLNDADLDIKFRITQDGGYTYTKWYPLTKENIQAIRKDINELRFAKVQYLIKKTNNSSSAIKIFDIILVGDFQNVSANGLKINKYGLKEDCITAFTSGNTVSAEIEKQLIYNGETNGLSCYSDTLATSTTTTTTTTTTSTTTWNPYDSTAITQITNLYSTLANQTNTIFGWGVDYYRVDPDKNGIDYHLHEYALYNVVSLKQIKVIVPENKFPDNTIKINNFNLDLFDTFEVHILKDVFKNAFGIEERPGENDILYFCIPNRLYYVKHTQLYKDIMNAGIYYKVILEKYEEKVNIQHKQETTKKAIETLTNNTTIDALFGFEKEKDENKIANKDQTYPKSMDKIRHAISSKVSILNEVVYNGEVDYIRNYYILTNMLNKKAIEYINVDNILNKNDDRAFISWFKFNSMYDEGRSLTKKTFTAYNIDIHNTFHLLDNYDSTNYVGYKYYYKNKKIYFHLNSQTYTLDVPDLSTNIWYGLIINLNQRQQILNIKIVKRMTDVEVTYFQTDSYEKVIINYDNLTGRTEAEVNGYRPVLNTEYNQTAISEFVILYDKTFECVEPQDFSHAESVKLYGSDICYSNLRIFDNIIEENHLNNILNQNVIKDAGHLIIADNANRKIYAQNIETKNFK
jgi:hypothetical protein